MTMWYHLLRTSHKKMQPPIKSCVKRITKKKQTKKNEKEMEKLLKTYQFFDKKGRRTAIFGEVEQGWLKVTVIPCSVKDQFKKEKANELFKEGKGMKEGLQTQIPVENGKYKATFLKWCNENYQRPIAWFERFNVLAVKNGKRMRILRRNISTKMGYYNIH